MSLLNVNQVDPSTGTTLTLGTSGDTITIPSGVTLANSGTATGFPDSKPYFMARLSGDQTITDNTETLVTFNSEDYDSGGCFNTGTYRFTPDVAGHYFIASRLTVAGTSPSEGSCQIRIDGNKTNGANWYTVSSNSTATYYASFIRYANGSSTYFDVLAYQNVGSGSPSVKSSTQSCFFGWRVA
tara:strand:- start:3704 stop:4255 length:552 start_codon:yes stop_codon:yes gene_type:complete